MRRLTSPAGRSAKTAEDTRWAPHGPQGSGCGRPRSATAGLGARASKCPATSAAQRCPGVTCAELPDPFGLLRFIIAQRASFAKALDEVRTGQKASAWMWFVIPTPPHIVNGVDRGSAQNRKYALKSDAEARAYLAFKARGIDLRANYLEIMLAVRDQLRAGHRAASLLGKLSAPKLPSSARLFERLSANAADPELHRVLSEVLALLEAEASGVACSGG